MSHNTTQSYLHDLGFRNCIAPKQPYLSEKHKLDRLKFSRAHESWSFEDWCNVIWSYESSFEIDKKLRQIIVWRRPYESYAWNCIAPTFKSGRTLVFEATLSGFFFLHDCPKQVILMEDGAQVHHSSLTLQWRQVHGLANLIWSANSPDLNPIKI